MSKDSYRLLKEALSQYSVGELTDLSKELEKLLIKGENMSSVDHSVDALLSFYRDGFDLSNLSYEPYSDRGYASKELGAILLSEIENLPQLLKEGLEISLITVISWRLNTLAPIDGPSFGGTLKEGPHDGT